MTQETWKDIEQYGTTQVAMRTFCHSMSTEEAQGNICQFSEGCFMVNKADCTNCVINVTLAVYIMYINEIPFIMMTSQAIHLQKV